MVVVAGVEFGHLFHGVGVGDQDAQGDRDHGFFDGGQGVLAIDQKTVILAADEMNLGSLNEAVLLDFRGQVVPVVVAHVSLAFENVLIEPFPGLLRGDLFQFAGMNGDHGFSPPVEKSWKNRAPGPPGIGLFGP